MQKLTDLQVRNSNFSQNSTQKFSFQEFNNNTLESLEEYFDRFKLKLQLCNIPVEKYVAHLRVYMGAELNNKISTLFGNHDTR